MRECILKYVAVSKIPFHRRYIILNYFRKTFEIYCCSRFIQIFCIEKLARTQSRRRSIKFRESFSSLNFCMIYAQCLIICEKFFLMKISSRIGILILGITLGIRYNIRYCIRYYIIAYALTYARTHTKNFIII